MTDGYKEIRDAITEAENNGEVLWTTKLISMPRLKIGYVTAHRYLKWMMDLGIIYTIDSKSQRKRTATLPINTHNLLYMEVFYQMNDDERRRMIEALERQSDALTRIADAMENGKKKNKIETKVSDVAETKMG